MGFLRYVAAKVKHVTESIQVVSNICSKCNCVFDLDEESCPNCAKGRTKAGERKTEKANSRTDT